MRNPSPGGSRTRDYGARDELLCVRAFTAQRLPPAYPAGGRLQMELSNLLEDMVGATGIEPVTPTMST
jgi:hypothetical protein